MSVRRCSIVGLMLSIALGGTSAWAEIRDVEKVPSMRSIVLDPVVPLAHPGYAMILPGGRAGASPLVVYPSPVPGMPAVMVPVVSQTPLSYETVNQSANPSAASSASYAIRRAHAFSQRLYNENVSNSDLVRSGAALSIVMPQARVALSGGVNQSAHPSSSAMANYSIARAHAYSQNLYRRP